jgi:hypothetical protein
LQNAATIQHHDKEGSTGPLNTYESESDPNTLAKPQRLPLTPHTPTEGRPLGRDICLAEEA